MNNYHEILNNLKNQFYVSENYKSALHIFVDEAVKLEPISIYLFGGFGREKARDNWSDVDILLVYKNLNKHLFKTISEIKYNIYQEYHIHLDVNILSENEVTKDQIISIKYNAKHANIFSGRPNIALCLYGQIESVQNLFEEDKIANKFQINQAIYQFRKSFIEGNYLSFKTKDIKSYIKKAFSAIRASLVMIGVYVHPYEDMVERLGELFPDYDVGFLNKLIDMRNGVINLEEKSYPELYIELFEFMDKYIVFINSYMEERGLL